MKTRDFIEKTREKHAFSGVVMRGAQFRPAKNPDFEAETLIGTF
jgi:hypothetical protein